MADFSTIPVRQNGQDIDAEWFNALRTAGIGLAGDATTFSILSAQSGTTITTFTFDTAVDTVRFLEIEFVGALEPTASEFQRFYGRARVQVESPYAVIWDETFYDNDAPSIPATFQLNTSAVPSGSELQYTITYDSTVTVNNLSGTIRIRKL